MLSRFNISLIVALVLTAGASGYVIGYNHASSEVVDVTVHSDTTSIYAPITGGNGSPITVVHSKPNNEIIKPVSIKNEQKNKPENSLAKKSDEKNTNNDFEDKNCPLDTNITFNSTDTLRHDSIWVALKDAGSCIGIKDRTYVFGGKMQSKTITNTITKVVEKRINLFQLNAGLQFTVTDSMQFRKVVPVVELVYKQKVMLECGRDFNNKQNLATFKLRIK